MNSTTTGKGKGKPRIIKVWAVLLWLTLWQAGSMALGQEILLVSPVSVLQRLVMLAGAADYWHSIAFSLGRIGSGFLLATASGVILAALSARLQRIQELLAPAMLAIKAIPVASFIILVLIWVPSRNLSVLISFLMVLPIIYTNVLDGIKATDPQLLEMARLFDLPPGRTMRYIYLSQVLPFFRAACSVTLGLCWKSGIAAEVIGIPQGSIGEKLYHAKIYLDTPDLFAWTLVIVLISLVFEKLFLSLVDRGVARLERM